MIETYRDGVHPATITAVLHMIKREDQPHEKMYKANNDFICFERVDSYSLQFKAGEALLIETILVQKLLKEWDMHMEYWYDSSIRVVVPNNV